MNPRSSVTLRDLQDNGREYEFNLKRAQFLLAAYPARFQAVDITQFYDAQKAQKENTEMPAMPKKSTRLEDGTYNFKVTKVETTKGEFGPQEEMTLAVLDDDMEETGSTTRCWIGHKSYKTIKSAIDAGVCTATYDEDADPDEDDPISWDVKCPVMFRGIVIDGKIKKFKRA